MDTFDVDLQHEIDFELWNRHSFTWGLEYRYYNSTLEADDPLRFAAEPRRRDDNLYSGFLQTEFTLIPEELRFTIGSKFQQSETSGFEVQPSARLIWTPDDRHSVWAAVSRGVRTPSFGEQNATLLLSVTPPATAENPTPFPVAVNAVTDDSFGSEKLTAYELGWRLQPLANLSLDFATFYNDYDRLGSHDLGAPTFVFGPPTRIVVPVENGNNGSGQTYGGEIASNWNATPWLGLRTAYSYLQMNLNEVATASEGRSPRHQLSLRALVELTDDWDLDLWLRYVDQLKDPHVDSYWTGDVRLAWRPIDNVELSIVGQNLFNDQRQQFAADWGEQLTGEVQRSVYGRIEVRF